MQEACCKIIAGGGGVDGFCPGQRRLVNEFFAARNECAFAAYLHHGRVANFRQSAGGLAGRFAGIGKRLLLVGKHDVHLRQQLLEEGVLGFYNIISCEVKAHQQTAILCHLYGVAQ